MIDSIQFINLYMEPFNFLSPNADNLFKFLFINGLLMIALGLFYPMQKANEIELKILEYNKKIDLLNQDVIDLKKDILKLQEIVSVRIEYSKSLVSKKKDLQSEIQINNIDSEISELKLKTNSAHQDILKNEIAVIKNGISLKNEKNVIQELKKQLKVYNSYCSWLFGIGLVLSILGFITWSLSTFFSEYKNYSDFISSRKNRKNQ